MEVCLVHFLGGFISYHGLLAGNLLVAMAPISGERSTIADGGVCKYQVHSFSARHTCPSAIHRILLYVFFLAVLFPNQVPKFYR